MAQVACRWQRAHRSIPWLRIPEGSRIFNGQRTVRHTFLRTEKEITHQRHGVAVECRPQRVCVVESSIAKLLRSHCPLEAAAGQKWHVGTVMLV